MNCKSCDYKLRSAKILKSEELCRDIKSLRIKLDEGVLDFEPGQFIMLSVLGYGEIPVGITTSPDEKDFFEVCIRKVGTVTKAILQMSVGDNIGVRGPYGNGFEKKNLEGKDLIVVAGGIGIAPLRSMIEYVQNHKKDFKTLQILYGAKTPEEILYSDELTVCSKFATVMLTVDRADSGWKGNTGIITELLDKVMVTKDTSIITCGPPIMYKFVIPRLEALGAKDENIHVLLERRMKCGIGKCQHCTFGDKYVCLDGPVFSWDQIKNNVEAI